MAKERDHYFDNAKFILIVFVVVAHLISSLKGNYPYLYGIWFIINIFHMDTLLFISGYFAKSYVKKDGKFNIQKPFTYMMLYIVSQIAVSLFEAFVLNQHITISILNARSSLWFLQGLFFYYLILPYISKLDKKAVIILGFVCGILIGYDQSANTYLNVMRGFVHFPIFMLGYYADAKLFEKIRKNKVRIPLLVSSAILVFLICYFKFIPSRIITCGYNYWNILGSDLTMGFMWLYRVIFYVATILFGVTFLSIVPKGKLFFTKLGTRTLQVYILHRFLYSAELQFKWFNYFDSFKRSLLLLILAIIITFVLSTKPFSYPFEWIKKIRIDKLLSKEEKANTKN